MAQRVVLVSCCIRGNLWSAQRVADLQAAYEALARLRKAEQYKNAILIAPYLLYGATSEGIEGIRAKGETSRGAVPHTEVLVVGEVLCDGVWADIAHAAKRGLPIFYESGSGVHLRPAA